MKESIYRDTKGDVASNIPNLSKIFGELFMLIEGDKRGIQLRLLYSDEKFAVPENKRNIFTLIYVRQLIIYLCKKVALI